MNSSAVSGGSRGAHDDYFMNKHLQATAKAMEVVSAVLNFDVVELWTQDSGKLINVYIYADEQVTKELPYMITTRTFYPDEAQQQKHKYTPHVSY
jgi:hypothetical protein